MDEHDHGRCSGDHVPAHMNLPNGGTGSGFDFARQRLYDAFKRGEPHHVVRTEYWGNVDPVFQCGGPTRGGYTAHGNGHVSIIRIGNP